MPLTSAERVRAYRARRKDDGAEDVTRRNRRAERKAWKRRSTSRNRPFIGCDGEGAGTDDLGRQDYLLFRMGARELYTGQRLSTDELLEFICAADRGALYVGFAFGYDVTMILRDLPEGQQRRLFEPKVFGQGHSPFVWYRDFDIDYLPRNYLKVRRVTIERDAEGKEKRIPVKGSTRTIYETFGFFQKSFLKVITDFEVGTEAERRSIAENKARRAEFTDVGPEERAYCALECRMLAELMEKLREYCHEADIRPKAWSGAGKLAAALHAKNNTPKAEALRGVVPPEVELMANFAYYGGRFEITRTGEVKGPVYEYDIKSAYPAAMPILPCLLHGRWEAASARALHVHDGLFVAGTSFRGPEARPGALCGLPVRSKEGHLYWPVQGKGVYWSPEIRSAEAVGVKCTLHSGWIYRRECDCKPFDWVEPLYNYRVSIGSSGPGYPIKLGTNSLYGKIAQRKGNGIYANMVWAGLITALTRAKINEAISESIDCYGVGRILMVATDAVYSLDPLHGLPLGDALGNWDRTVLEGLFIVQPGLYWDPAKRKKKSRGLSGKFFEEGGLTEQFERTWYEYIANVMAGVNCAFPSVNVPVPGFIGLKLALARNKPHLAGTWVSDTRAISFDPGNKRSGGAPLGLALITSPKTGGPHCVSVPHREFLAAGGAEPWEAARLMLEEQPDYIDLSAPWKD